MISISGSRCAATANASRTFIPEEYLLIGVSKNFSTPEKSTISSNFRSISFLCIPKIVPFRYTFSLPLNSGWKPVPTSRRLATRPRTLTSPDVGSVMRLIIFSNVLLPAPLRPITPSTSPSLMSNEISRSAQWTASSAIFSPPFTCPSLFQFRIGAMIDSWSIPTKLSARSAFLPIR